ncbi:hypothetical protein L1987_33775 [Smallanthus sonchifolius]|uniref:Uncharacterized protein n=1 Tax=Smallanthus sonchifolius TaxID=185202 RepID=A0ACB9HT68_9ASTR|nr:hypothetical protein L1987_33775 [Smallanthus sonchifolius]
MKCLISLNSSELVKEFVLNKETWKEHLTLVIVWEGQEIPYERVVKIRMDGLPIVLREENFFHEIAGLYGKVIEPFEFSWDSFDVSSGSCLVLHKAGNRIDEEIVLNWKNRSYPVWVKEVEHLWPPDLKEPIAPVMEGDKDGDENDMVDLEEGEIQPVVSQTSGVAGIPVMDQPEKQGEGETFPRMGESRGRHSLHGEPKEAHVEADSLSTPRNLRNKTNELIGGFCQSGSAPQMGPLSRASSRKRPRLFRSPISNDSSNGPYLIDVTGKKIGIPPFPDLNNPVMSYPGVPDGNISIVQVQPDGNSGEESDSVVPKTLPVGDTVDMDKEVADTIEVGKCVGIQIGDFEDQVRLLIHSEGVNEGNQ